MINSAPSGAVLFMSVKSTDKRVFIVLVCSDSKFIRHKIDEWNEVHLLERNAIVGTQFESPSPLFPRVGKTHRIRDKGDVRLVLVHEYPATSLILRLLFEKCGRTPAAARVAHVRYGFGTKKKVIQDLMMLSSRKVSSSPEPQVDARPREGSRLSGEGITVTKTAEPVLQKEKQSLIHSLIFENSSCFRCTSRRAQILHAQRPWRRRHKAGG